MEYTDIANGETRESVVSAMNRTHAWASICYDTHLASDHYDKQALFGIVQGGLFILPEKHTTIEGNYEDISD